MPIRRVGTKYKSTSLRTTRRMESTHIEFTPEEQEVVDVETKWIFDKFKDGTLGYGDVHAIFRTFKRLVAEGELPDEWYDKVDTYE